MNIEKFLAKPGEKIDLKKIETDYTANYNSKEEAKEALEKNIAQLAELQSRLYAEDKRSLLLVFQGLDASGKDGAIKHVMSGINPQGCQVHSFKQPSAEELDHGYLWRINKALPERGRIGIFNRSHYEDVLVVRVHNLIKFQKFDDKFKNGDIWETRYRQINDFEKYLYENGITVLKFFLHISKDEQKKRFLKRIDDPAKNWKIVEADIKERGFWADYQKYYSEAISATSKEQAPWYIIPADKKWFARLAISEIIVKKMKELDPKFPEVSEKQKENLKIYRELLDGE